MIEPTPPPVVSCDQTQPPALIPPLPPITTPPDKMLEAMDAWAVQFMAIYQREVATRHAEHACWRVLRMRGVIR